MPLRLPDFWRWSKALSVPYNNVVAAIAAFNPDTIAPKSVLRHHMAHIPSYVLTDFENSPEAIVAGPQAPTCEVNFVPATTKDHRVFCVGYWWPEISSTKGGQPQDELKIEVGTPYVHTYVGDIGAHAMYGFHAQAANFDPMNGQDLFGWRQGGSKCHITTHQFVTSGVGQTKIGLFTPCGAGNLGQALLVVVAEDNAP